MSNNSRANEANPVPNNSGPSEANPVLNNSVEAEPKRLASNLEILIPNSVSLPGPSRDVQGRVRQEPTIAFLLSSTYPNPRPSAKTSKITYPPYTAPRPVAAILQPNDSLQTAANNPFKNLNDFVNNFHPSNSTGRNKDKSQNFENLKDIRDKYKKGRRK